MMLFAASDVAMLLLVLLLTFVLMSIAASDISLMLLFSAV